jgi:L-fuculose-phosphate aldolase
MGFELLPPGEQIAAIMSRIYGAGMTTTSGGNVSIRDQSGDTWITPKGVDKGTLTAKDIVRVGADGRASGLHAPSSELPFHRAIYARRPDLAAIIHGHPPALVAFSIVRQTPTTEIIPQAQRVCGPVGYAPYEVPGSEALGRSIAGAFGHGCAAVIMENHGAVVAGATLSAAFQRFETLEFCARTLIRTRQIGAVRALSAAEIARFEHQDNRLPELASVAHPADERALRAQIVKVVQRATAQSLMISTYGTVSARWRGEDFLITPAGVDRRALQPEDVVQIKDGAREPGKLPSRSVRLHQSIYRRHPHVQSIILTQPPNAMAFAVSGQRFDTRTIPESYLLLKDVPLVPYGEQFGGGGGVVRRLSPATPILLLRNDCLLVSGRSVLDAFDRLEVAEFSARSIIEGRALGELVPIGDQAIADLKASFPDL